ncbi:hypothetical protein NUW54_g4858 [Trametes sanguinea]|uniref:Uncharacterized protein n=1 Tax=Trametes sanguinea TaxID=158606 RepID=A0ACC1PZ96_9APHY|nr:hypothetical protein NUW54_g4858 [Trametes sanguinea]
MATRLSITARAEARSSPRSAIGRPQSHQQAVISCSPPLLKITTTGSIGVSADALFDALHSRCPRRCYTWYHMSGAKRIVDTARATKERYDNTKAAVVEKRDAIRDKAAVASAPIKEKWGDLAQCWKERSGASTGGIRGGRGSKEDVVEPT